MGYPPFIRIPASSSGDPAYFRGHRGNPGPAGVKGVKGQKVGQTKSIFITSEFFYWIIPILLVTIFIIHVEILDYMPFKPIE